MPRLRFPGFEGEWVVEKLSDFSERVIRKNSDNETTLSLTISSKDGIVDQISYFNKTVASKDMRDYYLLKNGEFAYKRGAIRAIFSQELSPVSNTTQWSKRKLSELITLQSGQDFAPSDYNEEGEGIPYMTGASCIVDGATIASRWTKTPRCYAYKGDTLLVCKGSGSGTVVMLSQEKVHIARQLMALQPNEMITHKFCFYLTLYLSGKIKRAATGLIEGIDRKTVLSQEILLPPITEQEIIVDFLSRIDNILFVHEDILKNLIMERKGLFQKLFI